MPEIAVYAQIALDLEEKMSERSFDDVVQTQLKQRRFVRKFFSIFYNFDVLYNKDQMCSLKSSPVIFVGNHTSPWDMWVNFPQLDDETFEALTPIGFIGSVSFRTPWLHFLDPLIADIYNRHKVITYPKRDKKELALTIKEKQAPVVKALEMGHKVVIYAEGHTRRHNDPIVRPFRRGAAYLHGVTKAPIVPFSLCYRTNCYFRKWIASVYIDNFKL